MSLNPADALPPAPQGKQKLIEAALRLAARDGLTLSSLGLRELAREAGLNHNTFYRHFDTVQDLGEAAAQSIAEQLMAGMKEVRRQAARHTDVTRRAVDYFLDFVRARPEVFIVGVRELHSLDSPMRAALQRVLDSIAQESVDQIVERQLVPIADPQLLFQVCLDITRMMFAHALDLIERPAGRAALAARLSELVIRQFRGAMAGAIPADKAKTSRKPR